MLKVGIVGKNYCKPYVSAIDTLDNYTLIGIFDPSFQFEYPKTLSIDLIYSSFEDLLKNTDSIIFASTEKLYLPLIELAIKYSKSVFLSSVHNLSSDEQAQLSKLRYESDSVLQINQPIIFYDIFSNFVRLSNMPLLLNYTFANTSEKQLLQKTRLAISTILTVFKSGVRKVSVNILSVFSEIPDVIKVRIDFDNGGVAEIMTSSAGLTNAHTIKCYEYSSYLEVNLVKNTLVGKLNSENINIKTISTDNTIEHNYSKQLLNFYSNIFNCSLPINDIENEIATQKIMERVKEKLRIIINIY